MRYDTSAVRLLITELVGRSDIRVEVWEDGDGCHIRLHKGKECAPVCPLPPSPHADRDCANAPPIMDSIDDWQDSKTGDLPLMVKLAVGRLAVTRSSGARPEE